MFRADVLRLLPPQLDSTGTPTRKTPGQQTSILVFSGLATEHGEACRNRPTDVTPPQSAGASLSWLSIAMRASLSEGSCCMTARSIQPPGVTMTQASVGSPIGLQASPRNHAHTSKDNSPTNISEHLCFNDSLIAFNPFPGSGDFFDRGWAGIRPST